MFKKTAPVLCFALSLLMVLCLALPLSAKQPPKPQPQRWQIDGIAAALADDRDGVKGLALEKLTKYDPQELQAMVKPETVKIAASLLKDKKPYIRINAVKALGNLGNASKSWILDVVDLLKQNNSKDFQDSQVRIAVVKALSNWGDVAKIYIPTIANLLKNADPQVRVSAAYALSKFGNASKGYIPEVAKLLKDKDYSVRIQGAYVLSKFGNASKDYAPEITDIFKALSQNPYAPFTIYTALTVFSDSTENTENSDLSLYIFDVLKKVDVLKKDKSIQVVSSQIILSGSLENAIKADIPKTLRKLKEKDFRVRVMAVESLGRFSKASFSKMTTLMFV
jgi:HEAT repeat protein